MGIGIGFGVVLGCGLCKVLLLVELEAVELMAEVFGPVLFVFGGFTLSLHYKKPVGSGEGEI